MGLDTGPVAVLPMDIINDPVTGDLRSAETREHLSVLFLQGRALGAIAGPPYETWSAARYMDAPEYLTSRPLRS
eukprot:4603819-Pyramimonas_sp.AAC.1